MAVVGLVYFLIPGIKASDPLGAFYMAIAGIGWGTYSIIGKGSKNPVSNTAGNFALSCLISIPILVTIVFSNQITAKGIELAILSGAVASGLGYSIWYAFLP